MPSDTTEIERKFLVCGEPWRAAERSVEIRQGYLAASARNVVRVRASGERAFLTIKGPTTGITRSEFEYEIPPDHAADLLKLCEHSLIEKTRHFLEHGGHVWEIDVFAGDNAGLVVAEIELASEDEAFARPDWLGEEVSHDWRYRNAELVRHPHRDW